MFFIVLKYSVVILDCTLEHSHLLVKCIIGNTLISGMFETLVLLA